jgi:hypothetical protein
MKKGASLLAPETEGLFLKKKRILICSAAAVFLVLIMLGIAGVRWILDDSSVPLLLSEKGAEWVRFREPSELRFHELKILTTFFRTRFEVKEVPNQTFITFRAMKRAIVWLDGQIIFKSDALTPEWKKAVHVAIPSGLKPGRHELRIAVMNQDGHPALIAYCKPLAFATGENWEATNDGETWTLALPIRFPKHPIECYRHFHLKPALKTEATPLPLKFERADRIFLSKVPVFLPLFIAIFILTLLFSRKEIPTWLNSLRITAEGIHRIVLIAWLCMAVNNIGKVPLYAGMDSADHFRYIEYVATTWRIPLAGEGWQMFQPPLYYFISALLFKVLNPIFSWENVLMSLRIIPLFCGGLLIELCWRTLRYAFPGREDLQIVGTIVGGLLPMNLYISQFIGNEPLAGCLSAVAVFLVIRYLQFPAPSPWSASALMGLFLGLAMLTKITAVLLVFPVLLAVAYKDLAEHATAMRGLLFTVFKRIGVILGVAFLVSGWYYVRNYVEMGRFFIGGWDASRNIVWWQDPGYRILEQFYSFGESLFYPVYSAMTGVWDSLYSTFWLDGFLSGVCIYDFRPPWNYGFMLAGTWLALLPTFAIGVGMVASLINSLGEGRRVFVFCSLCVGIYLSAILYLFLTIPIYSTGKATYALGIVPCFAVLCAEGFNILTPRPLLKAVMNGIVACWAISAYISYFVI